MRPQLATFTLFLLSLFYIVMLGGGNYEQLTITTVVASAPPKSLSMMQGDYGFNPVRFWILFRPVTILLFIAAIVLNWKSPLRRKLLLGSFAIDCCITMATFSYFAPETGAIIETDFNVDIVDSDLLERMQLWKNLNWIRLTAFYSASILLLLALNRTYSSPIRN